MEEKPICRDCSPPSEPMRASASLENGCRLSIARSAPSRLFDCSWMLDAKLSRNEETATTEATPRMTHDIERSSVLRPRRASLAAILQIHLLKIDFMSIRF